MASGHNEINYVAITYRNVCYRVIVWSSYGRHAAFIGGNRRTDLGKGRDPEYRTRRYDASGCIFRFLCGLLPRFVLARIPIWRSWRNRSCRTDGAFLCSPWPESDSYWDCTYTCGRWPNSSASSFSIQSNVSTSVGCRSVGNSCSQRDTFFG